MGSNPFGGTKRVAHHGFEVVLQPLPSMTRWIVMHAPSMVVVAVLQSRSP